MTIMYVHIHVYKSKIIWVYVIVLCHYMYVFHLKNSGLIWVGNSLKYTIDLNLIRQHRFEILNLNLTFKVILLFKKFKFEKRLFTFT